MNRVSGNLQRFTGQPKSRVSSTNDLELFTNDYISLVLNESPGNLVAYWPLNEADGTTADNAQGTAGLDGTYSGVALGVDTAPGGTKAGLWGAGDYCDIRTDGLNTNLDRSEGTVAFWGKFETSAVASNNSRQHFFSINGNTGKDLMTMYKDSFASRIVIQYKANNTISQVTSDVRWETGQWRHYAMVWSATESKVVLYGNGASGFQFASALGTANGENLDVNESVIGASNNSGGNSFSGYIAHMAIWSTPLTDKQIKRIAQR